MTRNHTTISVREDTKDLLKEGKKQTGASSWDTYLRDRHDEVDWDEIKKTETEERVEQTKATVVGVLEGVEEAEMMDELIEILEALCRPDMLAKSEEIVDHLLERAKANEDPTEFDHLLAEMVIEIEASREGETTPAGEIAAGLFKEEQIMESRETTAEIDNADEKEDTGLFEGTDLNYTETDDPIGDIGSGEET